ncbi:MAG: DNA polymerase II large subunit [Candidatus Micrarchaeaceae archaeon]
MDVDEYFEGLSREFDKAYKIAEKARKKGIDPNSKVEIEVAPDLASRVAGIIGIKELKDIITGKQRNQTQSELAFDVVKEICTGSLFEGYDTLKRIELAIRTGLAILTEGVLVAPTEGIYEVNMYKNADNSNYVAIKFAGPIRGAGGTAAALSVALADYARKFFNIGSYKATEEEIERYVEEVELYDMRLARLQYKPPEDDVRVIVKNCPICIDGIPSREAEISVHRDVKRITLDGKIERLTNSVRNGMPLVLCEGIAQKAKKVLKEVKYAGLDWSWLNNIIKIEKIGKSDGTEKRDVFLEELVAGRPILAYPRLNGGFRLRYGRSRLTGIAAKGFNPATMIILDSFIAIGTQLKVELPGKGCVATPVDSIEGPFVKLKSGEALRINSAELARKLKDEVVEVLSLGDILITYGDFKKSNTPLQPSSYVEEFWEEELESKGGHADAKKVTFDSAYALSFEFGVPLHPAYTFEFQNSTKEDLEYAAKAIARSAKITYSGSETLFGVEKMLVENDERIKRTFELINLPHKIEENSIAIYGDYAKALLASLGFASGKEGSLQINELTLDKYQNDAKDALEFVNDVSPVRIAKRSTFIGARIGRPEKAGERLMKPAPNVLYPIGSYGGKERNISKAYAIYSKRLEEPALKIEIANYKCPKCKRMIGTSYCYDCNEKAVIERVCPKCGFRTTEETCPRCGAETVAYSEHDIDVIKMISDAMKRLGIAKLPEGVKGVKGMTNELKVAEPIEKGILRRLHNVHIFKDGTARFDATDVPVTHVYPREIGTSVEKLRELGYDKDYTGAELVSDDQLIELRHQDVIINRRGAEFLLNVSRAVDDMLERIYGLEPFYKAATINDLVGHLAISLSPHTSAGVLNRIIGFTDANVGFAHPYTISARRRNCDGDEDTIMLLLDALINFSRSYLPKTTGGTMDTPLILTLHVHPEEVDDEVHAMEVVGKYPLEFYYKTLEYESPSNVEMELVGDRLKSPKIFSGLAFTHESSVNAIEDSPKKSEYTLLKSMKEKIERQFELTDKIYAVDKRDAAKKLIVSHFIPDLIGNLHKFSKQTFRCSNCNAKYRRVPLSGKCTKCGGRLLLTVSKGGIEKYLDTAIELADRYDLEVYIKQRLNLVKEEINATFEGASDNNEVQGQFNLSRFM